MKFYVIDNQIILSKEKLNQKELVVQTNEGEEKHIPDIEFLDKNKVKISLTNHPMIEQHWINFICLETDKGYYVKYLDWQNKPEVIFEINEEKIISVYEYCNLHGVWKKELD